MWFRDGRFLGMLELHEKMHAPVCTLLESFRPLAGASDDYCRCPRWIKTCSGRNAFTNVGPRKWGHAPT